MDDFVPRFLFCHSYGTLVVTPSKRTGEGELGDGQIPSAVKVSSTSSWTLCVCLYIYLKQCSLYMDIYYITDSHTHTEYPLSRVIFILASIRLAWSSHISSHFSVVLVPLLSNIVSLWAHHVHFYICCLLCLQRISFLLFCISIGDVSFLLLSLDLEIIKQNWSQWPSFFSLALEDIDENTVYIIGGLVDESIQKVSIHFSLFIVEAFAPLLSYPEGLALFPAWEQKEFVPRTPSCLEVPLL